MVLLLHRDGLNIGELQFGFQQDTSTNMCTWLAVETIEYYLRNGSGLFACVMDMTKAFDKVLEACGERSSTNLYTFTIGDV